MNNITKLGQEFGQYMIQLTSELFLRTSQPHSLSEMERNIRMMLLKVGQFLLSSWLALQETSYPAESVPCPHCDGQASYQFKRKGTLLTILGQVEYKRAYYLCPECQQGHYPLDCQLELRPGQMSAELESLTGMTGAQLPFEQGSQLFNPDSHQRSQGGQGDPSNGRRSANPRNRMDRPKSRCGLVTRARPAG